ncbi:MAG: enolase C-terminal domain-like protein [Polaromonas sp.]|nr:enolase C-terminal domain-like protein [Polaromonas sp.]
MKITSATQRPCTQAMRDPDWKFARASVTELQGHVLVLTDDEGHQGLGYVHAVPAISTHGAGAASALELLAPTLVGRSLGETGAISEMIDAMLAFHPSVKAAVDMAMHDLLARRLGIAVHVLLGGRQRDAVTLSRIVPIKSPSDMAAQAEALVTQGYGQLKLKLSGETEVDVARVAAVRQAVGTGVRLTLDPNQSYGAKQMMHAYSRMERHDISLIEQPVPASDWQGLAMLTRSLPVDIEADESAQTLNDVFRLVSERTVDVINLKITKLGGLRRFMQAVHICEAGQVGCRMGAAFGPSLLQAMNLQAASVIHRLTHACELAEHQQLADDPFTGLSINEGRMHLPLGDGCGVTYAS